MSVISNIENFPKKYRQVQKRKNIIKDAEFLVDNEEVYVKSLNLLKPIEATSLCMIDSNLCTISTTDNRLHLISEESFSENISKQKINKAYNCLKNYFRVYSRYYPYYLKEKTPLFHKYIDKTPTENMLKFLYNLTLGNNDVLTDFAKLCYFITKSPFSLDQPLIIYANKSLHKPLINFFERLLEHVNTDYSLKSLLRSINLMQLYDHGLNSSGINIVELNEFPTTDNSIYKIKQVFSGQKLGIKNPKFAGKVYIKNRVPFVFLTDSHRKYIKFKQMFGAFDVRFDPNATFEFDNNTIDWFRLVFTKLGEKWLYSKNRRILRSTDTNDQIVQAFIRDICTIKDEAICKKASLHDAYCEYYKCYYAGEPLKTTSFGRALNTDKKFREFRKHISRNEYPWFYEGVTISKIKYERFKKSKGIKYHCSYDSFKNYILEWLDKKVDIPEEIVTSYHIDINKLRFLKENIIIFKQYKISNIKNPPKQSIEIDLPMLVPPESIIHRSDDTEENRNK